MEAQPRAFRVLALCSEVLSSTLQGQPYHGRKVRPTCCPHCFLRSCRNCSPQQPRARQLLLRRLVVHHSNGAPQLTATQDVGVHLPKHWSSGSPPQAKKHRPPPRKNGTVWQLEGRSHTATNASHCCDHQSWKHRPAFTNLRKMHSARHCPLLQAGGSSAKLAHTFLWLPIPSASTVTHSTPPVAAILRVHEPTLP